MKLLTAVVRPHRLDEAKNALQSLGAHGLTVTGARGHGRRPGHTEVSRGAEDTVGLTPEVRTEALAADEDAGRLTAAAVVTTARTGTLGDGEVWSVPVDTAVRARTGERGADAL
ncbi:P-II family nitrogen regulator [Streptomyces sp. AD55]|uniref:P-II family nitrogen regulator n=1 Tax=Streptomyces sp. AD55 TaxID=3242895 RepID=UPI0035297609